MKAFGKNFLSDIHIDPIQRDLLLILAIGFFVAWGIIGVVSFIFH
jgi:hypothetical protein